MSEPAVTLLSLDKLTVDTSVSARSALCQETIAAYAEVLRDGGEFPPCVAYRTADKTLLSEGFLRYHAYRMAGRKAMPCQVIPGTRREAVLRAAGANLRHGLPRSAADRRLSVLHVLQDDEGQEWPNTRVAQHCGVSVGLVAAVREIVKTATTPEAVVEAKIDWGDPGRGLPQAPAVVYRPDGPAPAPKPAPPTPNPAAPKPPKPPTTVNPWTGTLDPPRDDFEPSAKDAPDEEDEREPDEEEEDAAAGDAVALEERLRRSLRKSQRFASALSMDLQEALLWFEKDQAERGDPDSHKRRHRD